MLPGISGGALARVARAPNRETISPKKIFCVFAPSREASGNRTIPRPASYLSVGWMGTGI